jgi:serine/threonine protein kinase
MKRLLEKDPTRRITATEALNHDFFSKDEMFKDFTEYRKSHLSSEECNSPLMLTKNKERKNKGLTRDDSCLKFKMKENVMTGRTDEPGDTIE